MGFFAVIGRVVGHTSLRERSEGRREMKKLIAGLVVVAALTAACTSSVTHRNVTASATVSAGSTTQSAPAVSVSPTPQPSTSSVATTASTPSQPSSSASDTLNVCLHHSGHVYEVCTAYIANSSLAVLVPYYKYAKSTDAALSRYVTYRLGSRYTGQAYGVITKRVASWPAGTYDVSVPDIRILSVGSSLQTNIATLVTEESWKVTSASGQVIYQENGQRHTVTMHRVPSYLLHKWVVTDLQ